MSQVLMRDAQVVIRKQKRQEGQRIPSQPAAHFVIKVRTDPENPNMQPNIKIRHLNGSQSPA